MIKFSAKYLAVLLLLATVNPGHASEGKDFYYRVKPGDSLWNICKTYVDRPLCFTELGVYNKLSRHNLIAPGSRIKIPYAWLKQAPQPALVIYARGEVQYLPAALLDKQTREKINASSSLSAIVAAGIPLQPLPADGKLYVGDCIFTGNGSVRLRFADASELTLLPRSDLRLDKVSSGVESAFADSELNLRRGATLNDVPKSAREGRYRITTPAGVAAVRGTEFRVNVPLKEAKAMLSEVLAGNVEVANDRGDSSSSVDAGFGVRSVAGQPVPKPVKLLDPPAVASPPGSIVLQPYRLKWQALPGAQSYKMDIYLQSELISIFEFEGTEREISGLDAGEYEIRLRGVDAIGLQGLNRSLTLQVETALAPVRLDQGRLRRTAAKSRSLDWDAASLAASYTVEVASDQAFTDVLATRQVTDPRFEYVSETPVFVRVTAQAENGVQSTPSNGLKWPPVADNTVWWLSGFAILAAIILL